MITVRQIERLWCAKAYERLLEQLVSPRAEGSDRLVSELPGSEPAAAMAAIRLDELAQSFVPLYGELIRKLLNAQRPDGGWGDPMVTALCVRALVCGRGNGEAVDRGIAWLAGLQKIDGIWPNEPVRRMPVDGFASAFILLQLIDCEQFREAIRFDDALEWFAMNELSLDVATRRLWQHVQRRYPQGVQRRPMQLFFAGTSAAAASGYRAQLAV